MQENIKNRTIFCRDNLDILRGIDSDSIDLIYLDPPFNKKKIFMAPIGSSAEGASFKDIFREEDVKDEWLLTIKEDYYFIHELLNAVKNIEGRTSYNFCYLAYMAIRLMECHRVLKHTGNIYLHCDPTMSHYLKLLLDCIFEEKKFQNEIIWHYTTGGTSKNWFSKKHDTILSYGDTKRYFKQLKEKSYIKDTMAEPNTPTGKNLGILRDEECEYCLSHPGGKYKMVGMRDVWRMAFSTVAPERLGYPTQKPLALLERIIESSCPEKGVVLDPFCGCATTCIAAERLGRKWIGIDVSHKAYEFVKERLGKEIEGKDTFFHEQLVHFQTAPPTRTDRGLDAQTKKYVYIISHQKYQGEYKVGIASHVERRLSSYQTGDPDRAYKIEYSFHTPHFRAIESYIHEKYDNKHEWVSGALKDIIKDIENYRNN